MRKSTKYLPFRSRALSGLLRLFFYFLYNQFAWLYDFVADTVSLGKWDEWILTVLPYLNGSRFLELGHGTGRLQVEMCRRGMKVIGLDSEQISISGKLQFEPVVINENEIITRSISARSDIEAIRLQQQMSQSQVSLAKSGNKPNLFLFSGYNVVNGFDPTNPDKFVDNYNVGVQLAVPLFDGFATSHKVQQAELQYDQVQLQEQEIKDSITMQVRQAIIALQQSEEKIRTQDENIDLAKEAWKVAEKQYHDGLISSIEVLDAQHTLSQSELLRTQAIFNHIMTKVDLCRAMEDFEWFGEL